MLNDNWVPPEPEEPEDPDEPPPPSFVPTDAQYNDIPARLAKCKAMRDFNRLTVRAKELEYEHKGAPWEEKEAKRAELEEAQAALAEAEGELAELKGSFLEDPLALVPWMKTLFELADAGCTTFDVDSLMYPYTPMQRLFTRPNTGSMYDGCEKLLGAFKRRYEKERGPNQVLVITRLAPNVFADGWSPDKIESMVDKMRLNIFGEEALNPEDEEVIPPALDLVQLVWPDTRVDFLPTLRALQALTQDKIVLDEDTRRPVIAEGGNKKLKGFGLVDFPYEAIKAAIQAGIRISTATFTYAIHDQSNHAVLALCRQYGIRVFATGALAAGLVAPKYLGAPCPDPAKPDADLDSGPAAADLIKSMGGWARVQALLAAIKGVADRHSVTMQAVALRWQMDQGTTPVARICWDPKCWRQFGYLHWTEKRPGLDPPLFCSPSFLDEQDMVALSAFHKDA